MEEFNMRVLAAGIGLCAFHNHFSDRRKTYVLRAAYGFPVKQEEIIREYEKFYEYEKKI
jgi:hypothetical protein